MLNNSKMFAFTREEKNEKIDGMLDFNNLGRNLTIHD